jgi:hypothetical protein
MGDDLGYPWNERVVAAWGHFAPELLSVSIVAAIAVGLRPPSGPLMLTLPAALMLFVVASWLCMRRHDRRLCEQCAASMPLNAAERAGRYQRRFWLAHAASEPRYLVPYLIVLIGSNFAPGTFGHIVWAVAQSSMIYLIVSHSSHRRLQPWCPTCRTDGGGSHNVQDTPDPILPNNRQLV